MSTLFDALVDKGLISKEEILNAQREAAEQHEKIGTYLSKHDLISETDLVSTTAELAGHDFVDLRVVDPDRKAIQELSEEFAKQNVVMPYKIVGATDIYIAITAKSIGNLSLTDSIKGRVGSSFNPENVHFAIALESEILKAVKKNYRNDDRIRKISSESISTDTSGKEENDLANLTEIAEKSPTVKLVDLIISQAIADKASDIHFEPDEDEFRIRYRLDGVLRDLPNSPPLSLAAAVSSRIKIMSGLNIAEVRKPQDGRISVIGPNGDEMDLRISFLPLANGYEKIVMRILDNSNASLPLPALGFSQHNLDLLEVAYKKPNGLILVTGPTGSGKSTTLYSVLNTISAPEINIITVEDPVEYTVPRINQVQVNPNPNVGMTFANTLRSALRQDPDVILVGEMRDNETASTAMDASLTGHLVLSTLHTNDAASAVTRLSEMDIEPYLVASVVEAVVAQRLVRKLCLYCKEEYMPEEHVIEKTGFKWGKDGEHPIYRPVGCRECLGTGYSGRLAVHEVLSNTEEISRLILDNAPASQIDKVAKQESMIPMKDDGWDKVCQGLTHIDEVLRVVA